MWPCVTLTGRAYVAGAAPCEAQACCTELAEPRAKPLHAAVLVRPGAELTDVAQSFQSFTHRCCTPQGSRGSTGSSRSLCGAGMALRTALKHCRAGRALCTAHTCCTVVAEPCAKPLRATRLAQPRVKLTEPGMQPLHTTGLAQRLHSPGQSLQHLHATFAYCRAGGAPCTAHTCCTVLAEPLHAAGPGTELPRVARRSQGRDRTGRDPRARRPRSHAWRGGLGPAAGQNRRALSGRGLAYLIDSSRPPLAAAQRPWASRRRSSHLGPAQPGPADRIRSTCRGNGGRGGVWRAPRTPASHADKHTGLAHAQAHAQTRTGTHTLTRPRGRLTPPAPPFYAAVARGTTGRGGAGPAPPQRAPWRQEDPPRSPPPPLLPPPCVHGARAPPPHTCAPGERARARACVCTCTRTPRPCVLVLHTRLRTASLCTLTPPQGTHTQGCECARLHTCVHTAHLGLTPSPPNTRHACVALHTPPLLRQAACMPCTLIPPNPSLSG